MNGNRIKQIKMSKAKLENVVEKGLKSNTWTRPHNPSGPHGEPKRGDPSLEKTACTIGLCKRWPWVTYFGVPPKALELESFSFKFPPLFTSPFFQEMKHTQTYFHPNPNDIFLPQVSNEKDMTLNPSVSTSKV